MYLCKDYMKNDNKGSKDKEQKNGERKFHLIFSFAKCFKEPQTSTGLALGRSH